LKKVRADCGAQEKPTAHRKEAAKTAKETAKDSEQEERG
jgi:hypothetical protein